ncbi:MAG: hypothetical protein WC421_08180 [Elusimicrobiales bacterium]
MKPDNAELEKVFMEFCKDAPMHEPRPAWPEIADKLCNGARRGFAPRFAPALCVAAACLLLLFALPQVRAAAGEIMRRLLSVRYSLVMGGYRTDGALLFPDGAEKVVRTPHGKTVMRMEPMGDNAVLISAKVYDARGNIVSSPKLASLKNVEAAMTVCPGSGKPCFTLSITPEDTQSYKVRVVK